jgi:DNA repair protein SbcC/Rad50
MQLTTLRLRNYRVFAELDLEIPPGLVGIYGPNGSGKSSLLEAIMWVLYGRARTAKGEIRTSGQSGECSVELGFVHDDDHYIVRRSLSGVNATVKARVELGGHVAADGPVEVARFLRSTIGMDESAFRSSVFAEQKQLAAFSENSPDQRRKLILQLLGITPLEKARDAARSDYSGQRGVYERLINMLPVLDELEAKVEIAQREVLDLQKGDDDIQRAAKVARESLDDIREQATSAEQARSAHDLITTKGKAARAKRDTAQEHLDRLIAEQRGLTQAAEELEDLGPVVSLDAVENDRQRLVLLKQLVDARSEMSSEQAPPTVEAVSTVALEQAREKLTLASEAAASAKSLVAEADGAVKVAQDVLLRTDQLDGDECPTCGQTLADGVEAIRKHRNDELRKAKKLLDQRKTAATELEQQRKAASQEVQSEEKAVEKLRVLIDQAKNQRAKFDASLQRVAALEARVGVVLPDESLVIADRLDQWQRNEKKRTSLEAQLKRADALAEDIVRQNEIIVQAEEERSGFREQLSALAFDKASYETLQREVGNRKSAEESARQRATESAKRRARAEQELASITAQLGAAREQHEKTAELSDIIRYLGRTADLLNGFRQAVVASVGPRLSAEASALFNELPANDYDGLEVDPDTYAIHILDGGIRYPSERFSGSEVDLANLALRVAISEQVRFQAGGQVGLLVLDEALASLDVDRKDRMLGALTQLSARFRQILVVTHAPEVKERLPTAIEIRKLSGRRATARIVDFGENS